MTRGQTLNALEIARIACDIESEGIEFYRNAAGHSKDPEAEKTFKELSDQELSHLRTFRDLYKQMDEKMGGSESAAEYLLDDRIASYLRAVTEGAIFPSPEDARKWYETPRSLKEIVGFALQVEKSSILFYSEIDAQNIFVYSRELLKKIIEEEKNHLRILSGLLHRAA